jgi:hypothetical protein
MEVQKDQLETFVNIQENRLEDESTTEKLRDETPTVKPVSSDQKEFLQSIYNKYFKKDES